MVQKKVLLLCGSHNDLGLVTSLRKLGAYIILTGSISALVGEKYADEYIQADYSDKELILTLAQEKKIDAICQCCNDFGVYTAAYVAEKMGLSGYDSYKTTLLLHNKEKFKEFAKKHDITIPNFVSFTEEKPALDWAETATYPLILKPSDASAGNGIIKVMEKTEMTEAIHSAFSASRNKIIIAEQFISGTQHGFCTFLKNKKVVALSSNNEYSILNPYRVEIDTFPSSNVDKVRLDLVSQIEKIAEILSLCDGIFHLQYIMEGDTPYIIEVMRRVLGNMYGVPANLLTQFDWDYWETRAKCDYSCENLPENTRQEGFYAYKTLLAPNNGEIAEIVLSPSYEKHILQSHFLKFTGDIIEKHKSQPVGFLFLIFSNEEEMLSLLIEHYDDTMVRMKEVTDT